MHHPAKAVHFQQHFMQALYCQHDLDVHLLFCFDLDIHITCSRGHVSLGFFAVIFLRWSSRISTTCIAMPTWYICMYTYFVLASINLICSCLIHVQQQHAHLKFCGRGTSCYDRNLFSICDIQVNLFECHKY